MALTCFLMKQKFLFTVPLRDSLQQKGWDQGNKPKNCNNEKLGQCISLQCTNRMTQSGWPAKSTMNWLLWVRSYWQKHEGASVKKHYLSKNGGINDLFTTGPRLYVKNDIASPLAWEDWSGQRAKARLCISKSKSCYVSASGWHQLFSTGKG